MDVTIFPRKLAGSLSANPSKSHAHRLFICAALCNEPTEVLLPTLCEDLSATVGCLSALGAEFEHRYGQAEIITPIRQLPAQAVCPCGGSGSTLRFLLPIAGVLGVPTLFLLEGRLPYRPLSPLWEEMERHGCKLRWIDRPHLQQRLGQIPRSVTAALELTGQLRSGSYRMDGSVSSQFLSGLLMALPLLKGESHLQVTGPIQSAPYVQMTLSVLSQFQIDWSDDLHISGNCSYLSPRRVEVEGDWSNAAFWLAANSLGSHIRVEGLSETSPQGDKVIGQLLSSLNGRHSFSAAQIPDLIPILAVVAAAKQGAVITDIRRLRLKESDRVAAIVQMIGDLGGQAYADENTLTILPSALKGGTVDCQNDHRIAMAAAIASTVCTAPVTLLGADCVQKSYPAFWKEFTRLGGCI